MLAGTDKRIDAVVPLITWNDLSEALFPNFCPARWGAPSRRRPPPCRVAPDGVFKRYWTAALITSVVAGSSS